MVSSQAHTVDDYLAELPPERRAVVAAVRDHVNAPLPAGYAEGMGYGMIAWSVPLSRFRDTHNARPLDYVGLAAQKHADSLVLLGCTLDPDAGRALRQACADAGKKLYMGRSCLRFRSLDGLLLGPIGKAIAARYEANRRR